MHKNNNRTHLASFVHPDFRGLVIEDTVQRVDADTHVHFFPFRQEGFRILGPTEQQLTVFGQVDVRQHTNVQLSLHHVGICVRHGDNGVIFSLIILDGYDYPMRHVAIIHDVQDRGQLSIWKHEHWRLFHEYVFLLLGLTFFPLLERV